MGFQRHTFHLVDESPWPLVAAFSALSLTFGFSLYMHKLPYGFFIFVVGLLSLLLSLFFWWRDVIREGTYQGHHTLTVVSGIRFGVILFILSEVMFFFSLFWMYLHSSLAPVVHIGGVWTPFGFVGVSNIYVFPIPFINSLILLTSGYTVTLAHDALEARDFGKSINYLFLTIVFGSIFSFVQFLEYLNAQFTISDGICGSAFYLLTGFHGLHVIIGTIFLSVCFFRLTFSHYTSDHFTGFEAAAWYWHFVDVVWLFLVVMVYWWGVFTANPFLIGVELL